MRYEELYITLLTMVKKQWLTNWVFLMTFIADNIYFTMLEFVYNKHYNFQLETTNIFLKLS